MGEEGKEMIRSSNSHISGELRFTRKILAQEWLRKQSLSAHIYGIKLQDDVHMKLVPPTCPKRTYVCTRHTGAKRAIGRETPILVRDDTATSIRARAQLSMDRASQGGSTAPFHLQQEYLPEHRAWAETHRGQGRLHAAQAREKQGHSALSTHHPSSRLRRVRGVRARHTS